MVTDDLSKSRDKIERLLRSIDELQATESASQLAVKRSERELREEREKNLRLERELERMGAVSRAGGEGLLRRNGTLAPISDVGGSRRASSVAPQLAGDVKIEVPARKSSLTKGFL